MKFELVDSADRSAVRGPDTSDKPAESEEREVPGSLDVPGASDDARAGGPDDADRAAAAETTEPAEPGAAADSATDSTTDESDEPDERQDPQARLHASTRRLTEQVKQDAAAIQDSLSRLARQVADLESPLADTGHRPAVAPPGFRAERFSAGPPSASGDSAGLPHSGGAADGRAPSGPIRRTMEPDEPRERPNQR